MHVDVAATKGTVTINEATGDVLVLSSASDSGTAFCIYSNEGATLVPMVRGSVDAFGATVGAPICIPPSTW